MKQVVAAIVAVLFVSQLAVADTRQATVEGMVCEACASAIRERITTMEGIQKVDIAVKEKRVTIESATADTPSTEELTTAITELGYTVLALERVSPEQKK